MTGRERILTTIRGEIPDRVPVGLFIQEEFLAYYYPGQNSVDRVQDAIRCAQELGIDIMPRSRAFETPHFFKKSFTNWQLDRKAVREGNNLLYIMEISTPGGILRQIEIGPYIETGASGIHASTKEYLIKDERDLELFCKYVPGIDLDTAQQMKSYAKETKKLIGEQGVMVPWGWAGVFNQAATYRDVQNLLMDPYINEEMYKEYMEKLTGLMIPYNQAYADTEFDCLGIQGNIANSSMIGADFFNQNVLPYEKRLVAAIKETGTFTLYHNCGKAKVLQESYVEMGLDVWETVAEAPVGDNSLKEAKSLIGDRITLSGNLDQVVFLKKASVNEVAEKVIEILHIGKPGGRYIFAASDFLEKDTPIENIKKVIEIAAREGKY